MFRPSLACVLLLPALAVAASGGTPVTVVHSGYVLDGTDQPITGTRPMVFRIGTLAGGGGVEWEGTCTSVAVIRGYYTVALGGAEQGCAGTSADPTLETTDLPATADRWLEVEVDGVLLEPRLRLAVQPGAALAAHALDSAALGGVPAASLVDDATGLVRTMALPPSVALYDAVAPAFAGDLTASTLGLSSGQVAISDAGVTVTGGAKFTGDGSGLTNLAAAESYTDTRLAAAVAVAGAIGTGTSDPPCTTVGAAYYNTGDGTLRICNGSSFAPFSAGSGVQKPFGDESDADATLNGSNVYGWASLSGSTYTLNRHVYFDELEILAGITLDTNGFKLHADRLFGSGTVAFNGRSAGSTDWPNNGNNAATGRGGYFKTVGGSTSGAGAAAPSCLGNAGAKGGRGLRSGTYGATNAGGAATPPAHHFGSAMSELFAGYELAVTAGAGIQNTLAPSIFTPAGGAGAGSAAPGAGANRGPGFGGASGGVVFVAARRIEGTLAFEAKGGNGGDVHRVTGGSTGFTGLGGGAGGNGGVIILVYAQKAGTVTTSVTGGAGGSADSGEGGDPGNVGVVYEFAL